ncbi:hypothetical protein LCGC14_1735040 [marine sediment metagenome]|uniref:Branched-chain amino acid ABC transporter permease n=1 Tax=marine sediment metagenome TaxID=412755 RepID=A0A0F9K810_9ZZZZ
MIEDIMNMLFNGTLNGAVYALVALGYSLVYGVGGVMNLAHGAYFMVTGYTLLWLVKSPYYIMLVGVTNPFVAGFLIVALALLIITITGGLSYILLIKPLQHSQVGVVLGTFGLAFFIEQIVMVISGTEAWTITELQLVQGVTVFLGYSMINQYILLIIISVIIVSLFAVFISKSKLGKSIRAVSQDHEAASLMGINANRVLLYTVMISALLAGIAAFLYLPGAAISGPSMGWSFLTNSFSVVILGGMGSLVGSVVGAFIIGYSISFTQVFINIVITPTIRIQGPSWAHLIPIIIIIIVLLIRPRGLFGKKEID